MQIFIICSKTFYEKIPPVRMELEKLGHQVVLPNRYGEDIAFEKELLSSNRELHPEFKRKMFNRSRKVIKDVDAILALNFDKGNQKNYIGGATFLELFNAFNNDKKIFLWNDIPEGILFDEIHGFAPMIVNGDLSKISIN
jgi:hypothetical protein